MIYKNWPSNARLDCKLVDGDKLIDFFVVKTHCWKKMRIYLKIRLFGRDRILDEDS
jgi:hypothetical protein